MIDDNDLLKAGFEKQGENYWTRSVKLPIKTEARLYDPLVFPEDRWWIFGPPKTLARRQAEKEHGRRRTLALFALLCWVVMCCLAFIWWALSQPYGRF